MSGRGTAGGVVFQAEVGAYIAANMMSGNPMTRFDQGLPGTPRKVSFETMNPTDDLLVDTDTGQTYIQAKRTLSLSAADTELASATDQFVRQYIAGDISNGTRREFNPSNDRFLLAVSHEAPATIRNNLRQALDINRTGAATGVPDRLSEALKIFSGHIDAAWLNAKGLPITDAERTSILRLCSVAEFGENQRQIAEQALKDVVERMGDEATLLNLIKGWAADSQQDGTGGDALAIRLALNGQVRMKAHPSFSEDIRRLKSYSEETISALGRYTEINTPEGKITTTRTVTASLIAAARDGSLVIAGEPGAGKSGLIHAIAEELCKDSVTVVLTVESGIINARALQDEIRLEHPLLEVMRQLVSDKPAFLVLDALDAVRGGAAESVYRDLVRKAIEIPGWHVIASVRTFDLKQGKEWQRLFKGTPPLPNYVENTFPLVRHVHIGLLDHIERLDIAAKSPSLESAISLGGSKLNELSSNPFNLALLGELLLSGVDPASLRLMSTRSELLRKFWEFRIEPFGFPAEVSLAKLVSLTVDRRKLQLPVTDIPVEASDALEKLRRQGVIVVDKGNRASLRHHVIFDYLVARLVLAPSFEESKKRLNRTSQSGLFLTPSLGYWLEEFKQQVSTEEYWKGIVSIVGNGDIDPIVRVEAARIAVEAVEDKDNLRSLASMITEGIEEALKTFHHIAGTITAKRNAGDHITSESWIDQLYDISVIRPQVAGVFNSLIGHFIEEKPLDVQLKKLGAVSRRLFDVISTTPQLTYWLSRFVIPYLAKTFQSAPEPTKERILQIFSPDRFAKFGHIEVPKLADEVLSLAAEDEEIVLKLYESAFGKTDFSRDQITAMLPSHIMGFSSNAQQDFAMAKYHLSEAFPALLDQYPKTAIRAFGSMLEAVTAENSRDTVASQAVLVKFGEQTTPLYLDHSHSWAWNIEAGGHEGHEKMFNQFLDWSKSVMDESSLLEIPELLLNHTGSSLAWRALFILAKERPEVMGKAMWQSLIDVHTLTPLETREAAIAAVAAVYPFMDEVILIEAEKQWMSHDFSNYDDPEYYRNRIIGTLLKTIGVDNLATEEAKKFVGNAANGTAIPANGKPISFSSSFSLDESWLEAAGVDTKEPDNANMIALIESVKTVLALVKEDPSDINKTALFSSVTKLDDAWQQIGKLDHWIDLDAADKVIEGYGTAVQLGVVPPDKRDAAVSRILELSNHPHPQVDPDTEEQFSRTISYGTPSPRIKAAQMIVGIAHERNNLTLVQDRLEGLLLRDLHPAVRFHVANGLAQIEWPDIEELWALITSFASSEKNPSVIQACTNSFALLYSVDRGRMEALMIELARNQTSISSHQDIPTAFLSDGWLWRGAERSKQELLGWAKSFKDQQIRLNQILFNIRGAITVGYEHPSDGNQMVSRRALEFLEELTSTLRPIVAALDLEHPTEEQDAALRLFNEVATQLFYAAGYSEGSKSIIEAGNGRRFLVDLAPLLVTLSAFGTPGTVHHVLQLVECFVDSDPRLSFDIVSEALLRTTGVAKYEHEHAGAQLFVKLIGRYLADHRAIFTDEFRGQKLIDCLEIFVEAGWAEARQLFLTLPELLQ